MTQTIQDAGKKVPQNSRVALLLIDVITDFEFVDGDELLRQTLPMAERLSKFRQRAKRAGVAVIYVNDNFGRCQEDFKPIVGEFTSPGKKGREVVELLAPE